MGGLAVLARELGYRVSGMDQGVYPPMSTQLVAQGIDLISGYDGQFPASDLVLIGNALSRGNPAVERALNAHMRYTSGPAWLYEAVLGTRNVLAVAGTHGKTTTASMLAWILDQAGLAPGFLIGGVPGNFGVSARLGSGSWFVVEADEYDTAFFDKRSKFVHYRPQVAVLNNLEFDHADIFPDLAAIQRQFHHLVRCVPGTGNLVVNADDANLAKVLEAGCWSRKTSFGCDERADFSFSLDHESGNSFCLLENGEITARVHWDMLGEHNVRNAVGAIAAARQAGVSATAAAAALADFHGVTRRLQRIGSVHGIQIYDDFAHHPSAIAATLDAARRGGLAIHGRLWAIVEPRSNSMRAGVHQAALPGALDAADRVLIQRDRLDWDVDGLIQCLQGRGLALDGYPATLDMLSRELAPGDAAIFMSNGSFGGLPSQLFRALRQA